MKFFSNKLSWFIFYLNNKKLTLSEVKLLKENLNYSLINKMNLQSMHSQKIFSNLNDFKDGTFKPNQKIKTVY